MFSEFCKKARFFVNKVEGKAEIRGVGESLYADLKPLVQVAIPFLGVFLGGVFFLNLGQPERVYCASTKRPKKHPFVIRYDKVSARDLQGRSRWFWLRYQLTRKYRHYVLGRKRFHTGS